jgi:hypothetical protein
MTNIRLSAADRNFLLGIYRREPDPQVRQRAHILLLLSDGHAWVTIEAVLYTSPTTIARWKQRFDGGGVAEILGRRRGRPRSHVHIWASLVIG